MLKAVLLYVLGFRFCHCVFLIMWKFYYSFVNPMIGDASYYTSSTNMYSNVFTPLIRKLGVFVSTTLHIIDQFIFIRLDIVVIN